LIAIANFITTLPKLTSLANYSFWKICIKSTLTLITYSRAIFIANNMLNTLALYQTTDMDEIAKRNFLGSQFLVVLNSIFVVATTKHKVQ